MAARRLNFSIARRFVEPSSLVFLDESGATTHMTRLYGRSPVGVRCVDHTPHGHWKTLTMLSAIRLSGVVREATVLVDGAMNAPTFLAYAARFLAPSLSPGDAPGGGDGQPRVAQGQGRGRGDRGGRRQCVVPAALPPGAPDLNPIEKLWSRVEAWLRRAMARGVEALGDAVADALRAVTADECINYFRSRGYCHK